MSFAEVCVNLPAGRGQLFTYLVPPGMDVAPGSGVWVPFGARTAQGIVIALSELTDVEAVRPLSGLIQAEPFLSPDRISLAVWLADYYRAPLFEALALMLPPGFSRQAVPRLALTELAIGHNEGLSTEDLEVVGLLKEKGSLSLAKLRGVLGSGAERTISRLVESGWVVKTFEMAPPRVRPKTELFVALVAPQDESKPPRSKRQADLLGFLKEQPGPVPLVELKALGYRRELINALAKTGSVVVEGHETARRPRGAQDARPELPFEPSPAQQNAIKAISDNLTAGRSGVFLLHGVTGAGKTEVYLQALAQAVRLGRQGIVLVPEIALTPQTVGRFAARFPGRTAVFHSGLALGELYDTWGDIKKGAYDVVVGARSAVFAPMPKLGLIIMDEEHEWTYKQGDRSPRYHTRAVAHKLATLNRATVVLGSATPDVESTFRAKTGVYRLLELPERLTPRPGTPLPHVAIVDLRAELKGGNRSIFSAVLQGEIRRVLGEGDQVILFFNRRGSASLVQCRGCGYTVSCTSCSVALSYHGAEEALICHQCGRHRPVPAVCPSCGSRRIRFLGLGIQKVMAETAALFPQARLLRWDSDAARGKDAHSDIYALMQRREADILIGTQIVAKGLDLPHVTLVGVVSADTALGLPDFRAGERTFQLLSQVAGRAGRGERPGRVVIQTFAPEHYAIVAASAHNYGGFYQREIEYRRTLGYPPFCQLVSLTLAHPNEVFCKKGAESLRRMLAQEIQARGLAVLLLGPAPSFIPRVNNLYRWQITLKGKDAGEVLRAVELPRGWAVDVDPVGL